MYYFNIVFKVMAEGAESALFTQFFKDWMIKNQQVGLGKVYRHEKIAKIEKVSFPLLMLIESQELFLQLQFKKYRDVLYTNYITLITNVLLLKIV